MKNDLSLLRSDSSIKTFDYIFTNQMCQQKEGELFTPHTTE